MKKISFISASVLIAIASQANATSVEVYGDENDVIGMYADYNFGEEGKHYVTGEVTNDSFVELGYGYSVSENLDLGASYVEGGYGGSDEVRVKASTAFSVSSSLTLSGGVEYHHGLDLVGADYWKPTSGGKVDSQGHEAVVPLPTPPPGQLPAPKPDFHSAGDANVLPDIGINPHVLPDIGIEPHVLGATVNGNNESQVIKANLGIDYNIASTVVVSYDLDAYSQLADGIYVDGEEVDSEWSTSALKATYVASGEVQPYVKVAADNSDIEDTTFSAGVVISL